jgi:Ala-tRNA(Pro) deacylase
MVPQEIVRHLESNRVPYLVRRHPRAVSAQELAASVHASGYRVAKPVLVAADERPLMAVVPAADLVDTDRLAVALGAREVRLMREAEFAELFGGCEVGAEPPLGSLYDLPVVVDRSLARSMSLIFRAGSHEDALEMRYEDFAQLEHPRLAEFAMANPALPWRDADRLGDADDEHWR